jgi:hypothetical protein
MEDVPDSLLNPPQLRVKEAHLCRAELYFDTLGALAALVKHPLPAYFLDFETINFSLAPILPGPGMRPYQHAPFQFSLHYLEHAGVEPEHVEFLDPGRY